MKMDLSGALVRTVKFSGKVAGILVAIVVLRLGYEIGRMVEWKKIQVADQCGNLHTTYQGFQLNPRKLLLFKLNWHQITLEECNNELKKLPR